MKTKLTALLLAAVAALTLVPKQAQAGDKELALIGGFIGGLIVGSAINDSHSYDHHDTIVVGHDSGRYDRHGRHGRYDRGRDGYWDYRTLRIWIPAAWEIRYDYGRRTKCYVPGRYEIRRERVWVAFDRRDHHRGPRRW